MFPVLHRQQSQVHPTCKTTTTVESTLSNNNNISSHYDVSSDIPSISKSTTTEINKQTPLFENKIALIISVVVPTFVSLIIIVTFVIVILLRRRKKSCKGKQREPGYICFIHNKGHLGITYCWWSLCHWHFCYLNITF